MTHPAATVLFQCRQHAYVAALKVLRWLPLGLTAGAAAWIAADSPALGVLAGLGAWAAPGALELFLWNRSRFVVTDDGLSAQVRNGLFSTFEMHIRFDNVRDCAYSKNHLMHFVTGAGTLFARSSAGAQGDFQAQHLPDVEKVFGTVTHLARLTRDERAAVARGGLAALDAPRAPRTREQAVEGALAALKSMPGVGGVCELDDADRRFVFEHEEDRNHGVYEALRRQVTLCLLHGDGFRGAETPIVLSLGRKTVFPPVSFGEVRERNVVSSSPGWDCHRYLAGRHFPQAGPRDATVLVAFDL